MPQHIPKIPTKTMQISFTTVQWDKEGWRKVASSMIGGKTSSTPEQPTEPASDMIQETLGIAIDRKTVNTEQAMG